MKTFASRSPIAPVRTVSGRALLTDFVLRAAPQPEEQERGDVPGWVMITLVTVV